MDGKLIGLVRDALVQEYGEGMWDSLAGLETEPDGRPSDSLACWLGRTSVPTVADRYPSLFSRHADLADFIRGLGDGLPVSDTDDAEDEVPLAFRATTGPDGDILLRIEADCSICALVQGVIAGAAMHYGEAIAIDQIKSRKRGDNVCLLQIRVGDASGTPFETFDLAVGNA